MIRCEHCGSTLPDGAIFCGECGRAVTTSAARRTAPVEPTDRATPPPLQQPDAHGRPVDPAADAWLPESTLDPATRAWLTGADRGGARAAAGPDTTAGPDTAAGPASTAGRDADPAVDSGAGTPDHADLSPRSAPTHVHGSGSGLGDWTGASTPVDATVDQPEPTLDPDAFPAESVAPQDDLEVHRADAWEAAEAAPDRGTPDAAPAAEAAPVWAPPAAPVAPPTGPSWWIGRAPSADATSTADSADADGATAGSFEDAPRPGDTAAFQPLAGPVVERRTPRPMPLVTPGSASATCHVCGHTLEPDDIFCEECGSVRPAVTAAFTGPVMPLPLARPDWAADEEALRSAVSDAHELTEESDGLPEESAGSEDSAGSDDAAGSDVAAGPGETDGSDETDASDETDGSGDPAGPAVSDGPELPDSAAVRSDEPTGAVDDPADGDVRAAADTADADVDTDAASTDGSAPVGAVDASDDGADHPAEAPVAAASSTPAGTEAQPPTAAPLPPVDGSPVGTAVASPSVPDDAGRSGAQPTVVDDQPEADEDVEETRIVPRAPEREPFLLHFSTGERLGVHGSALLGRLPRPDADEHFDGLLTIRDPGKSVSKTHLELGRDGDDLWVSDRHSGNGTMIRHIDGSIRRCEPGRRYRVERGARVDIGEQFFLVQ